MGSTCTPTHSLSIKVRPPPASTLFPYTTLFRSQVRGVLGRRGGVDDGRGGLRGEGHVVVAHAHRDGPHAVLDARGVDVADSALGAGDDVDHTGGLGTGLGTGDRPGVAGLVGPHVRSGLGEVVGEVLGGARVVRAVHRDDVLVGQVEVRVRLGDGWVAPTGDLAHEHAGDRLGVHVDVLAVDAREVVGEGDRADVQRQLDDLTAEAALDTRLELLLGEGRVGATEDGGAVEELLPPGAGPGRVVGDVDVGVLLHEPGDPALDGGLLGGGSRPGDRAGELTAGGVVRVEIGRAHA